jgi:hypothetical protein
MIRDGLQWKGTTADQAPTRTVYNCLIHWSQSGVFDRIFAGLMAKGSPPAARSS